MGPPQRIRYNAKARQSTAGGHTKKRKRLEDVESSNVEMIVPEEAKEAKARRDALVCILWHIWWIFAEDGLVPVQGDERDYGWR
jgi:hypothetical protein